MMFMKSDFRLLFCAQLKCCANTFQQCIVTILDATFGTDTELKY